jgi:tetratricopeptide (TPR) repeat protein
MPNPTFTPAQALGHAKSVYRAGRLIEAEQLCQQIINTKRDFFEAIFLLASVQFRLGKISLALANYDRVLALRPNYSNALCNRGFALHELKRFEEALASYDRALQIRPNDDEVLYNRGNTLKELNRLDAALDSFDRALSLRPDFTRAHINRGNVLYDMALFDEALASYDRALAVRPDDAEVLFNRGTVLRELNRLDEALASYGRALALQPNFTEVHWNAATLRLLTGDFTQGWAGYEWRRKEGFSLTPKRDFPRPLWLGTGSIEGKTILLHSEQGLGDTIQFCRYVTLVAARGARVILEVEESLRELMRPLAGVSSVVAKGNPLPDFDLQCPLLSLPLAFGTQLETIPCATPYLSAPTTKTRIWHDRLGERQKPRIGLVWAGNPTTGLAATPIDRQRSIEFDRLAPLFQVTDCDFYSLQKGDAAVQQLRKSPFQQQVADWTDDLHDFSDTAALMENFDLVITVDTSVAHLAGAIGKPFWLLNRYNTCWRWLLDREDSPWYPTARLFRQDKSRDWTDVIARVQAALRDYFQHQSRRRDGGGFHEHVIHNLTETPDRSCASLRRNPEVD